MSRSKKVALAAAMLVVSTAAFAHDGDEAPQATVSFADLNLGSAKGVAKLQTRVRAAANAVCNRSSRHWLEVAEQKRCVTAAVKNAQSQIETAMHTTNGQFAMNKSPKKIVFR